MSHGSFVDVDPEARTGGALDVTVVELKHAGVDEVVEQITLLVVMDAQGLFLNEEVRCCEVNLQACGEGERS